MLLFFFSYVLRSKRKGKACFYRLCEERFGRKKKKKQGVTVASRKPKLHALFLSLFCHALMYVYIYIYTWFLYFNCVFSWSRVLRCFLFFFFDAVPRL